MMLKLGSWKGKQMSLVVLEEHIAREIGLKLLNCTCGCSFATAYYAIFHLEKMHPDEAFQERITLNVNDMKGQPEWCQLYTAVGEIIFRSIGTTNDNVPAINQDGMNNPTPPLTPTPTDVPQQPLPDSTGEKKELSNELKRTAEDSDVSEKVVEKRRKLQNLRSNFVPTKQLSVSDGDEENPPRRFQSHHKFTAEELFEKTPTTTIKMAFKIPRKLPQPEIAPAPTVEGGPNNETLNGMEEPATREAIEKIVLEGPTNDPSTLVELLTTVTSENAPETEPVAFNKKNIKMSVRKPSDSSSVPDCSAASDQQSQTPLAASIVQNSLISDVPGTKLEYQIAKRAKRTLLPGPHVPPHSVRLSYVRHHVGAPTIPFISSPSGPVPDPQFYPYPNFGELVNPEYLVNPNGTPSPMMLQFYKEFYDYVMTSGMKPNVAGEFWISKKAGEFWISRKRYQRGKQTQMQGNP